MILYYEYHLNHSMPRAYCFCNNNNLVMSLANLKSEWGSNSSYLGCIWLIAPLTVHGALIYDNSLDKDYVVYHTTIVLPFLLGSKLFTAIASPVSGLISSYKWILKRFFAQIGKKLIPFKHFYQWTHSEYGFSIIILVYETVYEVKCLETHAGDWVAHALLHRPNF